MPTESDAWVQAKNEPGRSDRGHSRKAAPPAGDIGASVVSRAQASANATPRPQAKPLGIVCLAPLRRALIEGSVDGFVGMTPGRPPAPLGKDQQADTRVPPLPKTSEYAPITSAPPEVSTRET
jgi:hypothetical protein